MLNSHCFQKGDVAVNNSSDKSLAIFVVIELDDHIPCKNANAVPRLECLNKTNLFQKYE
jgi:hypothetical protein